MGWGGYQDAHIHIHTRLFSCVVTKAHARSHFSGFLPYPLWVIFHMSIGDGLNYHP